MRGSSERYQRAYEAALRLRNRNRSLRRAVHLVNRVARVRPPVRFTGWGMTTEHQLPWEGEERWAVFRQVLADLRTFEFTGEAGLDATTVDQLAWRHWVVAFAVEQAMASVPRSAPVHAVECGVADGATAYVAASELERHRRSGAPEWTLHLYDSWGVLPGETLLETEQQQAGRYANLSLDLTRRNLSVFEATTSYHVGYLPESLDREPASPDDVVYVHIDLNAALPTLAVCERLWPRLLPGGVMVFDDYGWLGFEDTKRVVDGFFADKAGALLKFPTGQAVFLRSSR